MKNSLLMIKINKDTSAVPSSLQVPLDEFFPNGIPSPSKTTHKRRAELIEAEKYIDQQVYNDRYKQNDVQIALRHIYNNKCAFCEQKVEQSHIEHYRPKNKYYWLAYSWDNLLLACSTCNIYKGVNFELKGSVVSFVNTPDNIKRINITSLDYDRIEQPKMVNPEVSDPIDDIIFKRNGIIESDNERFAYTIEKCKIDRKYLNDERRKLLNIFQRDIRSAITENSTIEGQKNEIGIIIRKFIRDSKDNELQFLAFRRFAINNWLNDLVKEVKPS